MLSVKSRFSAREIEASADMRVFADVAYLLEYKQSNIKSDGNPKQDIQTGGGL